MCMEHKTVICYTKALRWPNVNVAIVHNATVSLSDAQCNQIHHPFNKERLHILL